MTAKWNCKSCKRYRNSQTCSVEEQLKSLTNQEFVVRLGRTEEPETGRSESSYGRLFKREWFEYKKITFLGNFLCKNGATIKCDCAITTFDLKNYSENKQLIHASKK